MKLLCAGLLAASVALGGCSLLVVDRPPPREIWPVEDQFGAERAPCTTSPVAPIFDGLIALATGGAALYVAQTSSPSRGDGFPRAPFLALPVLAYGGSSIYGFNSTWTCREYRARPPHAPGDR